MNNILMNTQMTKAILDGHKVQFREVIKDVRSDVPCDNISFFKERILFKNEHSEIEIKSKYQKGDTIYILEDFNIKLEKATNVSCMQRIVNYLSDFNEANKHYFIWEDAKHMLKSDARIFLKVTDVRVERLQDISVADMIDEGMSNPPIEEHNNVFEHRNFITEIREEWIELWDKTAPKSYKWEDNPYVFVYEFERV